MLIWKTFTQGKGSAHVLLLWKLTVDQINTLQLMPHGSSTTWTLILITKLKCFSVAAHMTCKLATVIEWTCALSFPTYVNVFQFNIIKGTYLHTVHSGLKSILVWIPLGYLYKNFQKIPVMKAGFLKKFVKTNNPLYC